jgi:hypothetical protein
VTDLPRDLTVLRSDLAAARLPPSRARVGLLAIALAATITAAALAANHYLGEPAPAHVNAAFRQLIDDPRWPVKPVLRETAKLVAFSPHGVLYAARAKGGGECLEFVTRGGTSYFLFCGVKLKPDARRPFIVAPFPFHGSAADLPPYVLVGLADVHHRLVASYAGGLTERVPLGLRGYFVFEPRHQAAARRGQLTLLYEDQRRSAANRTRVPPQLVTATEGVPVRRVTGYTGSTRARYASFMVVGKNQAIALAGSAPVRHGRFTWTVPAQRSQSYTIEVLLVDARFQPIIPNQDASPVPDASFWKSAQADAPR